MKTTLLSIITIDNNNKKPQQILDWLKIATILSGFGQLFWDVTEYKLSRVVTNG